MYVTINNLTESTYGWTIGLNLFLYCKVFKDESIF